MKNLIKRAQEMCAKLKIDPEEIVEIKNITDQFRGTNGPTIIGTSIKYFKDEFPIYAILLLSGWCKEFPCNGSKPDLVHTIRLMKHNSFKQTQIAQILGISQGQVSQLSRAKNIANHLEDEEYE